MAKQKKKVSDIETIETYFTDGNGFNKVKEHIATLADTKEKIKYLIEVKTNYQQNKGFEWDNVWETPFDEQCELEIKKLKTILELEAAAPAQNTETVISKFKLRESILSKADFIRIINALSEMKAFGLTNTNELTPNKKDVMIAFGNLVGLDLSSYHTDLNKALEKSEEKNFQIFDKLKEKASKIWNEKDQNIKK